MNSPSCRRTEASRGSRKLTGDNCIVTRYSVEVIRSFRHAGLEEFFKTGSKAGIQPAHANKLEGQLLTLDEAIDPLDMNIAGWRLHQLKGDLAGHWSVRVSGNWRMTFRFEGEDAILVDYRDYH
jgi:proteic killer suppression protein